MKEELAKSVNYAPTQKIGWERAFEELVVYADKLARSVEELTYIAKAFEASADCTLTFIVRRNKAVKEAKKALALLAGLSCLHLSKRWSKGSRALFQYLTAVGHPAATRRDIPPPCLPSTVFRQPFIFLHRYVVVRRALARASTPETMPAQSSLTCLVN